MPDEPVARSGLREQVAERLLTAIFEKRFQAGDRLIVQRLSELYGVSPTPVRESLVEIAGLGMVELLPNRGAVVKPFGPRELSEMCQVRRVLECEAARSACGKIKEEVLNNLEAEFRHLKSLNLDDYRDQRARLADTHLHQIIATYCGNTRLAGEILRYLSLFRALRNVSHLRDSWNDYRRSDDVPEHLLIMQALIDGKPKAVGEAMDLHIRSIEKALTDVMFSDTAGEAKTPEATTSKKPKSQRGR